MASIGVASSKRSGTAGVTKAVRKAKPASDAATDGPGAMLAAAEQLAPVAPRRPLRISTVSHTLDADIAERLRHFAFRERISESAVIEFALRTFFGSGNDQSLGSRLRDAGAALRRKR
jgi:hypothetical protein